MLKELKLENGPVFMQGFIDGETVRFYDPGLRFPGGETELFLALATGANLMKLMVEFALTGSIKKDTLNDNLYKLNGKHSIQLDFTCRPGIISQFIGLKEIEQSPFVHSIFTRYKVGSLIPDSGDVRQRVCEIGLLIDNGMSIKKTVKWVQSKFDVLDEKGQSMLVSQLSTDLLG